MRRGCASVCRRSRLTIATRSLRCAQVTSTLGHVYAIDFRPEFQDWDTTDPAHLFDAGVLKVAARRAATAAATVAAAAAWWTATAAVQSCTCCTLLLTMRVIACQSFRSPRLCIVGGNRADTHSGALEARSARCRCVRAVAGLRPRRCARSALLGDVIVPTALSDALLCVCL